MSRVALRRIRGFKQISLAAAAVIFCPQASHAATRFYTGPDGGAWNTAGNWNTVEGGGGSTGVPVNGDSAIIRGAISKNVSFDGSYAAPGLLGLTIDSSGGATLTLTQSANSLYVGGTELIGSTGIGVHTQSGGTNTITSGLTLGNNAGSTGTYNLSGTGVLSLTGALTVGSNGSGAFNQTGGTSTISSFLDIAPNLTSGSYTMSAGTLNFGSSSYWGYDGNATFIQTGGTAAGGSIQVGLNTGSGTINISNAASLTITGSVDLGGNGFGPEGTGVLNVSGGTMAVTGTLRVYNTGAAAPAGTRVNLSGGTLNVGVLDTIANPSRFNWTNGILGITGGSGLTIGVGGPFGTSLSVEPGKRLNVTNTLSVGSGSTLRIEGGVVQVGALNLNGDPAHLVWTGGSLGITGAGGFTVSSAGAVPSPFVVGPTRLLSVTNALTVNSGQLLLVQEGWVYAGSYINNGEIQLDGPSSQLNTGALTNNGLLNGDGRVVVALTNNSAGEVRAVGSDRLVFTAASNSNDGKINLVNGGTVEFTGNLTNSAIGRIAGRGTFISSGTLTNNGTMQMSGGFSDIFGAVTNNLDILITGGGTTTFYNPINNAAAGDINVAVNSAVVFLGAVTGTGSLSGSGTKYFADGSSAIVAFSSPGSTVVESPADVTTGHVRENALDVRGEMTISPNGTASGVSRVNSLSVTGRLNLTDNKIIVTAGPVGSLAGSTYTGITGLIQSGRNGIALPLWDGSGIVTSQSNATGGNFHSIGVSTAAKAKSIAATATALWGGQVVFGSDTLVMYTYGGDANLDGKINIDDYIAIDQGIAGNMSGWSNGDFNYDGKINIDDYTTVIDSNIANQNGFVFPTSGGIDVVAVPEPTSGALLMVSFALAARRRRVK